MQLVIDEIINVLHKIVISFIFGLSLSCVIISRNEHVSIKLRVHNKIFYKISSLH